jgi:uncharacterized protein (DUF849 family)
MPVHYIELAVHIRFAEPPQTYAEVQAALERVKAAVHDAFGAYTTGPGGESIDVDVSITASAGTPSDGWPK